MFKTAMLALVLGTTITSEASAINLLCHQPNPREQQQCKDNWNSFAGGLQSAGKALSQHGHVYDDEVDVRIKRCHRSFTGGVICSVEPY
jgi:hypothetical protein